MKFQRYIIILCLFLASCTSNDGQKWIKFYEETVGAKKCEYYYDRNSIVKSGNSVSLYAKTICPTRNGLETLYTLELDKFQKTIKTITRQDITSEDVKQVLYKQYDAEMIKYEATHKKNKNKTEEEKLNDWAEKPSSPSDTVRSISRKIIPDTLEYALLQAVQ